MPKKQINISDLQIKVVDSLPTSSWGRHAGSKYAFLLEQLDTLPNGQMLEIGAGGLSVVSGIKTSLDNYIKKEKLAIKTATRQGKLYIYNEAL